MNDHGRRWSKLLRHRGASTDSKSQMFVAFVGAFLSENLCNWAGGQWYYSPNCIQNPWTWAFISFICLMNSPLFDLGFVVHHQNPPALQEPSATTSSGACLSAIREPGADDPHGAGGLWRSLWFWEWSVRWSSVDGNACFGWLIGWLGWVICVIIDRFPFWGKSICYC